MMLCVVLWWTRSSLSHYMAHDTSAHYIYIRTLQPAQLINSERTLFVPPGEDDVADATAVRRQQLLLDAAHGQHQPA